MNKTLFAVVFALSAAGARADDFFSYGTVRCAWFDSLITPKVGTAVAGYERDQFSTWKADELHVLGLALDDGEHKALLMSFDLLGMDGEIIRRIRKSAATALGTEECYVMLTCTHTHSGPETRTSRSHPETLNREYVAELEKTVLDGARGISEWRECAVAYSSVKAPYNRNRRYVTGDNHASFLPHRPDMYPLADGSVDAELGLVYLVDRIGDPIVTVGNWAAHPLASHSPARGGLRLSADYPGFFRDYISHETGSKAMFVQGACGDLVPLEDELGTAAARDLGEALGKRAMRALVETQRNPTRYVVRNPKIGGVIVPFDAALRRKWSGKLTGEYAGLAKIPLEIQCLSVGDIAFAGMPGEIVNEIGQEIKWHSPFRRTFIAYLSTSYFDYMSPRNFLVAGGYEAQNQRIASRDALRLVVATTDALCALRESTHPDSVGKAEPYPDYLDLPLVDIPGGVKGSKLRLDFAEEK